MTDSILDSIREQVNSLSADEVRAQLLKVNEQKAKQRAAHKGKGGMKTLTADQFAALSPEDQEKYTAAKAKRKAYNEERAKRPEVKEKMKAYHQKPEVKERMKLYHTKRNAKIKALMARAVELGIDPKTGEPTQPAA